MLTSLMEDIQDHETPESEAALKEWSKERDEIRFEVKIYYLNKLASICAKDFVDTNIFHIFISPWFLDRVKMKNIFNSQFGSVFRTYHNPTYFSRRLFRFADIYMSSMTNLLNYSVKVNFDIFFSIFFSMSSLIFSSFSTIAHILSETRSHASRVHELFHVKLKL